MVPYLFMKSIINKTPIKFFYHGKSIQLLDFIKTIENITGIVAIKTMVEMQKGDVYQTYADTSALEHDLDYIPGMSISEGIEKLYSWYICYTKPKYKVTFVSWDEKLTQCF
jgi:nucleoside-diphosphate-sugar epimerase